MCNINSRSIVSSQKIKSQIGQKKTFYGTQIKTITNTDVKMNITRASIIYSLKISRAVPKKVTPKKVTLANSRNCNACERYFLSSIHFLNYSCFLFSPNIQMIYLFTVLVILAENQGEIWFQNISLS